MAVNIATLAIKFIADTTGIKSGVGSVVGSVLTGAAAIYGFHRAVAAFTGSADRIDHMSKVADRLGTSFETIQGAALGAKLAGLGLDDLTNAIDHMSKKIGSGGMSLDKRFLEQAEAIAAIKDPAEQAKQAMELFGKSGAKLLPVLKQGGKAFKDAADLIKRFNLGISDVEAKNVERMNDSWTKMGAILSGTIDKIVANVAPAMGAFLDHSIDQLSEMGDLLKDLGISWEGIGDIATKQASETANLMDLWKSNVANWRMAGELLKAGMEFDNSPEQKAHMDKAKEFAKQGQDAFGRFWGDKSGMEIRDEAEARRHGADKKKPSTPGGTETRLRGVGADRDSQAAAKIINAGTTNLTAAEKAAIESAKTEREHKLLTEKMLNLWINRPPIVLGVASF